MKDNKKPESQVITSNTIAGSDLEGIIRIENPAELDEIAGGDVYGPVITCPPPSPPPMPPTTYPGETPLPNSPAWGPYPTTREV